MSNVIAQNVIVLERSKDFFPFAQESPSKVWDITHGLGRNVEPICYDETGKRIYGGIKRITYNRTQVIFNREIKGNGICL